MDGLECNEILLSETHNWNPTFRIDSEFFNKDAVNIDNKLRQKDYFQFDIENIVSGPFGSSLKSEEYLTIGEIPFIRIENIKGGFYINTNKLVYISSESNERIKNSQLKTDDIILSKVGNTIGFFARVDKRIGTCNISENNIGIKMDSFDNLQKMFILTYLNSKHAQILINRRTSGNAQPKLNVGDVSLIPIPIFSNHFYKMVSELICKSEESIVYSEENYKLALEQLNSVFKVSSYKATIPEYSEKAISESFYTIGRLDAEYYQPKYEHIEKEIATNETVVSLCNLHDSNYNPEIDKQYKYIELANVGKCGEISNVEIIEGKELPSRARRHVKTGQVIISSVEGSLDSCALITEEYNDALCSTGFYVIDSDKINSETLLILFKSEAIQALLKQRCSGTILTAISKEELLNMPLPEIDDDVQKAIASKVQKSFALRKKSKDLLEYAKQTVEMAIEQGEDKALEWLKNKEI